MAAKKTRRTPKQKNRPQKGDFHAHKGKDHASQSAMKQMRQHKQSRGR